MPFYRLYPLSPLGRYRAPEEAICADDGEALRQALELGQDGVDVWQLTRFVGRVHVPPADKSDGAAKPEGQTGGARRRLGT